MSFDSVPADRVKDEAPQSDAVPQDLQGTDGAMPEKDRDRNE